MKLVALSAWFCQDTTTSNADAWNRVKPGQAAGAVSMEPARALGG